MFARSVVPDGSKCRGDLAVRVTGLDQAARDREIAFVSAGRAVGRSVARATDSGQSLGSSLPSSALYSVNPCGAARRSAVNGKSLSGRCRAGLRFVAPGIRPNADPPAASGLAAPILAVVSHARACPGCVEQISPAICSAATPWPASRCASALHDSTSSRSALGSGVVSGPGRLVRR